MTRPMTSVGAGFPAQGININALGEVMSWNFQEGYIDFQGMRVYAPDGDPSLGGGALGRLAAKATAETWASAVERVQAVVDPPKVSSARVSTKEAAQRSGYSQEQLTRMAKRAPPDLPGAPFCTGEGERRQHFLWDLDTLPSFIAAYGCWEREEHAAKAKPAPQRPNTTAGSTRRRPHTGERRPSLYSRVKLRETK